MKKYLLLFIAFVCAIKSFGQAESNNAPSKIYFIRKAGSMVISAYKTFIDEELVCRLKSNNYSIHEVSPGKHIFSVQISGTKYKESPHRVEMITEPGKSYYFLILLEGSGITNDLNCLEITENAAKKEMRYLPEARDCK